MKYCGSVTDKLWVKAMLNRGYEVDEIMKIKHHKRYPLFTEPLAELARIERYRKGRIYMDEI